MSRLLALAALTALASPSWAATRTITLSVPGMNCAACPITISKSLTQVSGVSKTEVSLETREARVTFDDTKASVETLLRATREAGYPSTVAAIAK